MDRINITGLEVFAHHGVYREENVLGQKFIVDVSMMVSTKEAGRTDDIRRSVNYGLVCDDIQQVMKSKNYKLIENLQILGKMLWTKPKKVQMNGMKL